LKSLEEFAFGSTLFHALSEGHASEMAAKRTAMENATKNAGEMIDKLTLTYNRSRQAAITNDLIDIITGKIYFFFIFLRLFIFIFILLNIFIIFLTIKN